MFLQRITNKWRKYIFIEYFREKCGRNVIFKKNQEYAVTGMVIKPDIVDSDIVKVTDQKKLESLSKRIQELVKITKTQI